MPDQTTADTHGRKVITAMGCIMGLGAYALVIFALAAVVSWASPLSWVDSLVVAAATAFLPIFSVVLSTWLYGRKSGGPIVLDCGPHPMRSNYLVGAATSLLTVGLCVWSILSSGPSALGFATLAMFGQSAVAMLIEGTGRLQVREGGLLLYWRLIRWDKIKAYRLLLLGEKGSSLWIKPKGPLSFFRHGIASVPREHQQAVDELLRKYCPLEPSG